MAWFLQFRIKAFVGLPPPIRRLPPAQPPGSSGLVPENMITPGFDSTGCVNDASSKGLLALVFRHQLPRVLPGTFHPTLHHHGTLPQQLGWFETCS